MLRWGGGGGLCVLRWGGGGGAGGHTLRGIFRLFGFGSRLSCSIIMASKFSKMMTLPA